MEKELLIQEKEKLYVELKHILARQPGPEVAEQLQIYQQTLREKTKQMKVRIPHGVYGKLRYLLNIFSCVGDGVRAEHVRVASERIQVRD